MPNVQVTSNVSVKDVDTGKAMAAISKAVATALDKSEQVVMVQLNLDTPMLFGASDAPCAMIHLRSIGKVDAQHNPTTASVLTETVSQELSIPKDRIFMNIDDVQRSNWAKGGILIPEPKQ
ncbi:Macrophage migration inhibitory factor [Phytophthora citrophthora]|uniref:L-dopachrome isomerase n=1 Tax=Phytophthora citrophthora TaxID=4793 RepID=A0AAD9GU03_9STRA|nr:Macrophage migration inhibitory factor [Phytophthora citrophthora]